jgi:hypothetical protein
MDWIIKNCVRNKEDEINVFTVIIVPGDIGLSLACIAEVFIALNKNYDAVCYVPGNHEAWKRKGVSGITDLSENSVTKLREVLECALKHNVFIGPVRVTMIEEDDILENNPSVSTTFEKNIIDKNNENLTSPVKTINFLKNNNTNKLSTHHDTNNSIYNDNNKSKKKSVLIVPLYSWYHASWDSEPNITHKIFEEAERTNCFANRWRFFLILLSVYFELIVCTVYTKHVLF